MIFSHFVSGLGMLYTGRILTGTLLISVQCTIYTRRILTGTLLLSVKCTLHSVQFTLGTF